MNNFRFSYIYTSMDVRHKYVCVCLITFLSLATTLDSLKQAHGNEPTFGLPGNTPVE